ncbi:MAG: Hsp33 family molecular chaperone HslO [Firmicutes bacterium]|nr:Hsp33 family molecular chaperone HslO [Bacillota bacterium]
MCETNTKDYVVQATAANGQVRALAAVVTGVIDEAVRRHQMWPLASAALGRTMAAAAMIGAMQKGKEKVTIQIIGDGPLEQITADSDGEGNLRGYVQNPYVDLPLAENGKLNVKAAVGNGHLWVIRDLGLGEPYRGGVPLVSGEIAEDFANYFAQSEQTPSAVALGVLVGVDGGVQAAGGLILQLLPEASEGIAVMLEHMIRDLPPVSSLIDSGSTPEDIIEQAIGDLQPKYLHRLPLRFSCTCSRERCEAALIALGAEELEDLIREQGRAELTCRFCQEQYLFDEQELKNLQAQARKTRDRESSEK